MCVCVWCCIPDGVLIEEPITFSRLGELYSRPPLADGMGKGEEIEQAAIMHTI